MYSRPVNSFLWFQTCLSRFFVELSMNVVLNKKLDQIKTLKTEKTCIRPTSMAPPTGPKSVPALEASVGCKEEAGCGGPDDKLKRSAVQWRSARHRCDKPLQRLQKILCKRVYYFVNVYLNKNHISETIENYDGKPSTSALRLSQTVRATKIISGQDNSA